MSSLGLPCRACGDVDPPWQLDHAHRRRAATPRTSPPRATPRRSDLLVAHKGAMTTTPPDAATRSCRQEPSRSRCRAPRSPASDPRSPARDRAEARRRRAGAVQIGLPRGVGYRVPCTTCRLERFVDTRGPSAGSHGRAGAATFVVADMVSLSIAGPRLSVFTRRDTSPARTPI